MDRVAAVEAQLNRKENRRLRLKQLEARKRQQERQRNERDAKREEYYRRQMAAEEQLCRNVWDEEKRIVQEELRKKDEVVAAKVREDIVKIRKQANELGIDVRTPGLGGIKRLEALQQRIKHLEDSKERSMEARKRFDDRQEQAPKNRREIVNYAAQQFKTNFIAALDTLNSKEVKHMIDHGADPNCQSVNGVTPLVRAILEGHKYLLRELIKAGGTQPGPQRGETLIIRQQSTIGASLVSHGSKFNHLERPPLDTGPHLTKENREAQFATHQDTKHNHHR